MTTFEAIERRAEDGAAVSPWMVGVQWHPEFMDPKDPSLIDSRPLLRAFLAACELRKRTGKAAPVAAVRVA